MLLHCGNRVWSLQGKTVSCHSALSPTHAMPDLRLRTCISEESDEICNACTLQVVLVGHDLGGLSVTYAMEYFHHKLAAGVFLAAMMLPSGFPLTLEVTESFKSILFLRLVNLDAVKALCPVHE